MEFKRVAKDRRVQILYFTLLIALICVFIYQHQAAESTAADEYSFYEGDLESSSYEEEQKEYADAYSGRISSIIEQSDSLSSISIFQKTNSFSSRNISKTKKDYEKLSNVSVGYGDYEAIEEILTFEFADYLIFLFGFFLVWMFFEDEQKGLKQIFYATVGGRKRLALERMGVLAIGDFLFVVSSYWLLFLVGMALYGGIGSVFNSAQSVMLLESFVFKCNILGFLIGYVLIRFGLVFSISVFSWMILSLFRNRVIGVCVSLIVLGGEGILSKSLSDLSPIVILKYVNIFRLLQPEDVLYVYRNYNFCGIPFNCTETLAGLMLLTAIVSSVVCAGIMIHRRPLYTAGRAETVIMKMVSRLQFYYHKMLSRFSILLTELHKILIVHKGIIFIAVWLYLLVSQIDTTPVYYAGTSAVLKDAYNECTGSDSEILREYIESLEGQMSQMADNSIYRNAVDVLNSNLEYMEYMREERGIDVWFLNEKPYKILLTGDGLYDGQGYGEHQRRALYNVILLVFLLSSVFSYDKACGMEKMLRCTEYGRNQLFGEKIGIAFITSLFIGIISYGLEFYETNQIYPLTALAAPVQSISFMENYPLLITIGAFLILLLLLRITILFAISMIICLITNRVLGVKGIACALVLTSAMEAVSLLGFDWCRYLSVVQALVYVQALQESGFIYSIGLIAVVAMIGVLCFVALKKYWCGGKYHAA